MARNHWAHHCAGSWLAAVMAATPLDAFDAPFVIGAEGGPRRLAEESPTSSPSPEPTWEAEDDRYEGMLHFTIEIDPDSTTGGFYVYDAIKRERVSFLPFQWENGMFDAGTDDITVSGGWRSRCTWLLPPSPPPSLPPPP